MKRTLPFAFVVLLCAPAFAQNSAPQGSATAGSAGSAAVDGNSASTLGVGGVSNGANGQSAALGMGASAAGDNAKSRAAVHGNNNLNGNAMAMAHEGGDMAKSHTICHDGDTSVDCKTKTMAH